MVRDDPEADIRLIVVVIRGSGYLGRGGDDRDEKVGVVVGKHALAHRGDALQAHAGVYGGPGKRGFFAAFVPVVLHEHQVPQLEIAVAVAAHRAVGPPAAHLGALVYVYLGAGAAGAGVAHGPEVFLVAQAHNARKRKAHLALPQLFGIVVGFMHADPKLVGRQLVAFGEKLPGEADGVLLEVVAEAEVAQHLEKGVMPGVRPTFSRSLCLPEARKLFWQVTART